MSLTCEMVRERLADGESGNELTMHLATCEACTAFASSLDAIDAELESLPRIDASDALVEATLARVAAEELRAGQPLIVSSPSILVAAFAVLAAALGALVVAPLTFFRWLASAARFVAPEARAPGASRATSPAPESAPPPTPPSRDEAAFEPPPRGFIPRFASTFAIGSALCMVVLFATWQKFGNTVKTKTRGAESVVNALPTTSTYGDEETRGGGDFWGSFDEPSVARAPSAPAASTTTIAPSTGYFGGEGDAVAEDIAGLPSRGPNGSGAFATAETGGRFETDLPNQDQGLADVEEEREVDGRLRSSVVDTADRSQVDRQLAWRGEGEADGERSGATHVAQGGTEVSQQPATDPAQRVTADRGRIAQDVTTSLDGVLDYRSASARWVDAQRTTGLSFAAHDGWWENTYVPGDAAMRVLHARLAAAGDRRLSGVSFSPLSLAETTSPTVPAVAAPTERAVALGVHADVTAIEGPTRVRMEVAIRGIAQAAGRRGALRVALVIDARRGLDESAQGRIRSIVTALSRSAGSRDRVMLVAAGPHGGTLVELGTMRAGQIEIALRHLFAGDGTSSEASLQAAVEGALEGVASDDGAGLVLLATPDGAHDAALDQALHVGAIAGVVTSAVGLTSGVALSDLDAIALAGQGRRCLVLSETDATAAVRSELTAAARLVARALRVRVRLAPGVELVDVIGSRALDAEESRRTRETEQAIDQQLAHRLGIGADRDDDQDGIRILLPSFYSGDSHTVMLDLLVTRPGPVADVDVQFKDLVRLGNGSVSSALSLASGTSPRGPHEQRVVASFLAHEVAGALEAAGDRVAVSDWAGARSTLEEVRSLIAAARAEIPALSSSPSVQADDALLGRYLTALSGADPLLADSLHYAAQRRLVLPQLATSAP